MTTEWYGSETLHFHTFLKRAEEGRMNALHTLTGGPRSSKQRQHPNASTAATFSCFSFSTLTLQLFFIILSNC